MFTCEACGKVCRSVHGLTQHKKIHGLEPDGPLKCFVCGKGYLSMPGLLYHKRNDHGSNDKARQYEQKLKRKAEQGTHTCPYCPVLLQQSQFDAHHATHHRDKFTFVFRRVCDTDIRQDMLTAHLKNHNFRGHGCEYMPEDRLIQLVIDSKPAEVMTTFVKNMKSCDDFEYRQTAGLGEYLPRVQDVFAV